MAKRVDFFNSCACIKEVNAYAHASLDIRSAWGYALVLEHIFGANAPQVNEAFEAVNRKTWALGVIDYCAGEPASPPGCFQDSEPLCREWLRGHSGGFQFLADEAMKAAALGCGLSDVLYEARLQENFELILRQFPGRLAEQVEALLCAKGYAKGFEAYEAQPGECVLTGIAEDCCPCGRHP